MKPKAGTPTPSNEAWSVPAPPRRLTAVAPRSANGASQARKISAAATLSIAEMPRIRPLPVSRLK
ncbi:MAG: hypothetical protein BWX64_02558 [Acidobacteria bacterium ADurb.Bin051]|nr:MAG: hypothetical protein BWX64_02558 [Acidobacteria bacterium ADurb.Bin051]